MGTPDNESAEVEAVVRLPASLPPEMIDFVGEQLGRIADAVHNGEVVAVVPVPSGATAHEADRYSQALQAWSEDWWSKHVVGSTP